MSIATPQELVGHAVAGDKLTDITDLKGALYNEVRKKTAKGFYQESLTKLEAESPLQNDKLRQVLNNFGTKIDDTTGEVKVDSVTDASGRSEQNLVDELKEEITLLEELSDKGFGALDAGKQDRIRDIVKERLQSNAAISKDLSEKGNLNTFITELIQSPAFLPKLKSIVNDHARDGELDSSFLDAYQAWKDAEAELNEEETKATHAQDRLNRVKIELRSYEKGENGFEGTLYRKMEDLKTQGTAPQEDIINIQGHIDELRVQVDKLERQTNQTITMPTSETPVALAAAHATLNTEQDTVNDYTKKIRDEREKTPPNQDFINDYNSRIAAAQEAGNAEELEHYKELLREETRKVGPNERLIETWQSQLRSATTRRDSAEAKLRSLEASQPQLGDTTSFDRIDSLRRQIRESERELAEKKASLNDYATFEKQYELLKQQEDIAVRELAEATGEKTKKEGRLARARQEYQRAVNLRKGQQNAFAEKLKTSYGEAGHRVIVDQMVFANSQARILHEEFEKKSFKDSEKSLSDYLAGDRWHHQPITEYRGIPGFRRKVVYRPVKSNQINEDWRTFLSKGEDAVVKNMLLGSINPATKNPYTAEEIEDAMDDEETMTHMKDIATKNLVLKKIQMGGLTPEDVDFIVQKQLKMRVDEAISQRGDLKEELETLLGVGALERHDFKTRLAQVIKKRPWLLFTLLGFPFALISAAKMNVREENLSAHA